MEIRFAKSMKFVDVSAILFERCLELSIPINMCQMNRMAHSLSIYPNRRTLSEPTIKYFKDGDSSGEDYQGGRDFDSLKQFVEDELEVKCSVEDPSECSDKEKAYIEKMKAKSAEERSAQLARLDGMSGGKMKAELKRWLGQRIRILKQLDENKDDEF